MRRISFGLTQPQFLDQTKTVTRRVGWKTLKPGVRLLAVDKCMGFVPGERAQILGEIEVVDVRREPLSAITREDVAREGFPDWTKRQFIDFFKAELGGARDQLVTRIEFRHVPKETTP